MTYINRNRIKQLFLPSADDSHEIRKTKLLNIFIFGTEIGFVLLWIISLLNLQGIITGGLENVLPDFIGFSIVIAILWIIFLINNQSSTVLASILFLLALTLLIFILESPEEITAGESMIFFLVPILLSSFIITPWCSIIFSFSVIIIMIPISIIHNTYLSAVAIAALLLIAFIMWLVAYTFETSLDNLSISEKKYQDAYNQIRFYEDLFYHDLNNILQTLRSSTDLANIYLKDPEKMQDFQDILDIIEDQIERGKNLVINVKRLSELEERMTKLSKIKLINILKSTIVFIKKIFQINNLNIQLEHQDKNFKVCANELLFDVFKNLISNAITHNNQPEIEVIIKPSKINLNGSNFVKIEIIDNGIGIPDDRKEEIFMRAYKSDNDTSGLGLGLSLAKKIIESYEGKIWVEDRVTGDYSKGSNFIILIPEAV